MKLTTADVRGVLLDIEGTVTPIAFVHQVLFPYARSRVKDYLASHFETAEVKADVAKLREEHAAEVAQQAGPPPLLESSQEAEIDSISAYVRWLIDRDRKSPGLKSLQGRIWKDGYLDGTLRANLFPDVAPAMNHWRNAGLTISIYSSGSALAQKLLFAHTDAGDLTGIIQHYFDTSVGPKTVSESYGNIARLLNLPASKVLFISDVVAELDAAHVAGMKTLLCVRPGNQPQTAGHAHDIIEDFNGVLLK